MMALTGAFLTGPWSTGSRSIVKIGPQYHLQRINHIKHRQRPRRFAKMSTYTATSQNLLPCLNRFLRTIPQATGKNHKGSHGRIGVVGGSPVYAGAPFYAAMAVLRAGGDLSYVYADKEAASVIKGYSPELMVEGDWLGFRRRYREGQLHGIIVGCGMGREQSEYDRKYDACSQNKVLQYLLYEPVAPIIIDADGLWWLKREPEYLQSILKEIEVPVVLTPNAREAEGLESVAEGDENVIILLKGRVDEIRWKGEVIQVHEKGTERRFGGQGDILAGLCGLFCGWAHIAGLGAEGVRDAAVAASFVARRAAREASIKKRRSTSALDMLDFVGSVVDEMVEGPIKLDNQS